MNKTLLNLIGAMILLSTSTYAQPTLTANGVNPTLGESTNFFSDTLITFAPGSAGAGQTWNLSSYTPDVAGPSTVVAVSSTPDGSYFPLANLAASSAQGYAYSNASASAYQYCGVSANGVTMSYSNPEDLLHFPFTYTNTYQDSWLTQFTSTGYVFERRGTTTVTADGYGTLITPAGTFTDVLRVRLQQSYQDSTNIGIPYIITYVNDEYIWYAEGIHSALATMFHLTASVGADYYGGSYRDLNSNVNNLNSLSSFEISPNPASEQITLSYDLTKNSDAIISIFNSQGEKVKSFKNENLMPGENNSLIDISDLGAGIYFAQISSNGSFSDSKKFIVIK